MESSHVDGTLWCCDECGLWMSRTHGEIVYTTSKVEDMTVPDGALLVVKSTEEV